MNMHDYGATVVRSAKDRFEQSPNVFLAQLQLNPTKVSTSISYKINEYLIEDWGAQLPLISASIQAPERVFETIFRNIDTAIKNNARSSVEHVVSILLIICVYWGYGNYLLDNKLGSSVVRATSKGSAALLPLLIESAMGNGAVVNNSLVSKILDICLCTQLQHENETIAIKYRHKSRASYGFLVFLYRMLFLKTREEENVKEPVQSLLQTLLSIHLSEMSSQEMTEFLKCEDPSYHKVAKGNEPFHLLLLGFQRANTDGLKTLFLFTIGNCIAEVVKMNKAFLEVVVNDNLLASIVTFYDQIKNSEDKTNVILATRAICSLFRNYSYKTRSVTNRFLNLNGLLPALMSNVKKYGANNWMLVNSVLGMARNMSVRNWRAQRMFVELGILDVIEFVFENNVRNGSSPVLFYNACALLLNFSGTLVGRKAVELFEDLLGETKQESLFMKMFKAYRKVKEVFKKSPVKQKDLLTIITQQFVECISSFHWYVAKTIVNDLFYGEWYAELNSICEENKQNKTVLNYVLALGFMLVSDLEQIPNDSETASTRKAMYTIMMKDLFSAHQSSVDAVSFATFKLEFSFLKGKR